MPCFWQISITLPTFTFDSVMREPSWLFMPATGPISRRFFLTMASISVVVMVGVMGIVSAVLFAIVPYDKLLMLALMLPYTLPAPFIIPLFADMGEDGEYVATTLSLGTVLTVVLFPLVAAFSLM